MNLRLMKIKTANDFEESLAVFLSGIGLSRIDERCAALILSTLKVLSQYVVWFSQLFFA